MKMDFPQVDLPTEVLAWTNVTEDILNIYKQSCRLQACIVAICTEGSMKASINLLDYEIRPNDLITLLPGTIIQFRERIEKVCLCFVGFSAHCTGRVNLMKNIGNAYPKLLEQPVVPLSEDVAGYLKDYFALLSRASCNENFDMDPELVEFVTPDYSDKYSADIPQLSRRKQQLKPQKRNLPGTDPIYHRALQR